MICRNYPPFQKDLKKLSKRFRTLARDLENWISAVLEIRKPEEWESCGIVTIAGHCTNSHCFHKVRKFSCKSLRGKGVHSGIRIVFLNEMAAGKITLIQIYYKGDAENEDRERLSDSIKDFGLV